MYVIMCWADEGRRIVVRFSW